ncbi:MAG TPA: sugar ABC transporter substrate-binding protein [Actinomycetota bacterium]|nr:sugar ABC transporter substrate-binding protein [Actinomycetota bacterium]
MVIHSDPSGTYWGVVKKGAEDAARDLGISFDIQGSADPAQQADLVESAIASGADGIAVTFAAPDAMAGPVAEAVEAGIPVVGLDSGINDWKDAGAIGFVGQDEYIAGRGVGERLNEEGLSKVICAIHEVANVALDDRCRGIEDTFEGEVVRLQIQFEDPAGSQATIKSALEADPDIDGIVTLNPDMATASALPAIQETGRDVALATFDLGPDVLTALEAGDMLFAVDAQPYLQGYLPVLMLVLNLENLNTIGGGQAILTGPGFVTAENAATVAQLVEAGTR